MTRFTVRRFSVVLFAAVLLSSSAIAIDGYSLSATSAIETPTETVSYEGQEFTITAISRISADDSITVTADAPADDSYYLNLRGPDNQIISSEFLTGDASETFSYFGTGEAGSYAATISHDGSTVTAYPFIIAGYDITLADPGRVSAGNDVTITATVNERDIERHSDLETVQVIVGNEDVQVEQEMTSSEDGSYSATISTAGIDPETYNVYIAVRGDQDVRQRAELLGVSDTGTLTVADEMTATPTAAPSTEDGSDPSNTGGDQAGDGEPQSTQSATARTTSATVTAVTSTQTSTPSTTEISTSTQPTASQTHSDPTVTAPTPPQSTTSNDNILNPTTGTESQTPTSGSGPGLTVITALLAIVFVVTLVLRRHGNDN